MPAFTRNSHWIFPRQKWWCQTSPRSLETLPIGNTNMEGGVGRSKGLLQRPTKLIANIVKRTDLLFPSSSWWECSQPRSSAGQTSAETYNVICYILININTNTSKSTNTITFPPECWWWRISNPVQRELRTQSCHPHTHADTHMHIHTHAYTWGSSFFLWKITALGVLCCFALLFVWPCLLLSFFLLHLSLTCIYMYGRYM